MDILPVKNLINNKLASDIYERNKSGSRMKDSQRGSSESHSKNLAVNSTILGSGAITAGITRSKSSGPHTIVDEPQHSSSYNLMMFCHSIVTKNELKFTKYMKLFSSILTADPDDFSARSVIKWYGRIRWKHIDSVVKQVNSRKIFDLSVSKAIEMLNTQIALDLIHYSVTQQFEIGVRQTDVEYLLLGNQY